jgi:hypothetical protein
MQNLIKLEDEADDGFSIYGIAAYAMVLVLAFLNNN